MPLEVLSMQKAWRCFSETVMNKPEVTGILGKTGAGLWPCSERKVGEAEAGLWGRPVPLYARGGEKRDGHRGWHKWSDRLNKLFSQQHSWYLAGENPHVSDSESFYGLWSVGSSFWRYSCSTARFAVPAHAKPTTASAASFCPHTPMVKIS